VAGLGLLSLMHHDARHVAEQIVGHLHFNSGGRFSRVFLDAADALTEPRTRLLIVGALAYVTVRFVEAFGLWHRRRWAEWFAAVSGAIYIPFELYQMHRHGGWLAPAALALNILVVALMCRALLRSYRPA
jgi:uncharacterized membrane protein (DUF2068 family)